MPRRRDLSAFPRMTFIALAFSSFAGDASAQDKPGPIIPIESDKLLGIWDTAPKFTHKRASGFAEGIEPIVLTWDRAYRLALTRSDRRTRAEALAILGNNAELTATEFDKLFVALNARPKSDDPITFRDPAHSVLEAVRLFHVMESKFHLFLGFEQALWVSVRAGTKSEIGALRDERMLIGITAVRRTWLASETAYRNVMDDLKFELGVPLETPLVVDRSILDGFRRVFDEIDRWEARSGHTLDEVGPILVRLPKEPDFVIEGKSVIQTWIGAEGEKQIVAAAKSAEDDRSALRIRKQLREFVTVSIGFEYDKNELTVATKEVDRWVRKLFSPAPEGADAARVEADFSERLPALMKSFGERQAAQERLVNSWIEAQVLRHELERALGSLPPTRGEYLSRFESWGGR